MQALIIGPEGTEVQVTIIKGISRETKSIVLTRRGAGKKPPPKKTPPPPPPPIPEPQAAPRVETPEPMHVATPSFQPPDGHLFPHATTFLTHTISIQCETSKAQIRYTLDGSEPAVHPVPAGLIYGGGGIQVRSAVTVKAIAAVQDVHGQGGWSTSRVAAAAYSFQPTPPPTPSPPRSPPPPPAQPPLEVEQLPLHRSPCPVSPVPDTAVCVAPERAAEEAVTKEPEQPEPAPAEEPEPAAPVPAQVEQDAPPPPPTNRPRTASKVVQERQTGLYAHVKSRLHKTTASIRAKDVTNDRFSGAHAGHAGSYQHIRPSTHASCQLQLTRRPSTAAPVFGGHGEALCDVGASVSSNANVQSMVRSGVSMPNFGVHMATGVGQLVGLPRDVYSLVSPMDPNRRVAGAGQRQPGRLAQSGGNGEGGTVSHLCRPTSGRQSPKVLLASSPLARRGKIWGPDAVDKGGGGDAFVRRPKQGAAGVLANHHADTQRGLQDTCDTTWAVSGMRMETDDAEDGADAQGSSQHQGLHQLLAASTRRVAPKKSSTAAAPPGRAIGGPGSVSSGQLRNAHRRVFRSETLLATVPGRSGVTRAVALYGRETGTGLNARDGLVRSNSAEDLLAAVAAGPRGFVGGGVSKGAQGRELFPSDRVP
jgi:hypothetical protein